MSNTNLKEKLLECECHMYSIMPELSELLKKNNISFDYTENEIIVQSSDIDYIKKIINTLPVAKVILKMMLSVTLIDKLIYIRQKISN